MAVAAIAVAFLVVGLGGSGQAPKTSGSTTTTSTSYAVTAASVIGSAAPRAPAGYSGGQFRPLDPNETGLSSGGYAVFSSGGVSTANMTVLVFDSQAAAQVYGSSVVSNFKNLGGYSDLTQSLSAYGHYGLCYAFGEADPEGVGAVATGVCTKGNVYIQVHVASTSSFPSVQEDLAAFVGAAYGALG